MVSLIKCTSNYHVANVTLVCFKFKFFFYNSKIDFLFFSYINKSKNAAYNYFFKCHVISFCDNVKKILKKKNKKTN